MDQKSLKRKIIEFVILYGIMHCISVFLNGYALIDKLETQYVSGLSIDGSDFSLLANGSILIVVLLIALVSIILNLIFDFVSVYFFKKWYLKSLLLPEQNKKLVSAMLVTLLFFTLLFSVQRFLNTDRITAVQIIHFILAYLPLPVITFLSLVQKVKQTFLAETEGIHRLSI